MRLPPHSPLDLAVLISGGGTTLANLIQRISAGTLDARIKLVVSSTAQAAGLQYAREAGLNERVIEWRGSPHLADYSDEVFAACRDSGAHLVAMGGFLKQVLIPADFENRVLNIHPSLIPAFCGQGLYGRRVHEAVLAYGARLTGCTVHFVDNEYDHGPILLQRAVPVVPEDTPESLAARVFAVERESYPEALSLVGQGRVRVEGRRVMVDDVDAAHER